MPKSTAGNPPGPRGPPQSELAREASQIADKENQRRRGRARYARQKAAGTLPVKPPISTAQRTRYNTNRREKAGRARARVATAHDSQVKESRSAGLAIVSSTSIHLDTTRWIGPRATNGRALEDQADELLAAAAARDPRAKPAREDFAPAADEVQPGDKPTLRELITERWIRKMRL